MQQIRKGRPLYRALRGVEIRLTEIYPGDWNDPIACQLHYVPLDRNASLDYVALSLYSALRQLRSFGTTGDEAQPAVRFDTTDPVQLPEPKVNLQKFRLWADALCINQKDNKDQEHQIPLMGQIYRCANDVFVWLGENEPQDEPLFRGLSEALLIGEYLDPGFAETFEKHVVAAKKLLLRPWFTRLWVVQEIALPAKEPPLFFAGRNHFSLRVIYSLSWCLDRYRSIDITPVLWIARLWGRSSLALLPDTHQPRSITTASGAEGLDLNFTTDFKCRFLLLQSLLKGFKASRPHNYVYEILGLCGPHPLPPTLAPEYRKPFQEVCRDYAVATIKATGSLRVLAREKNCLVGVPSWVPDFSADSTDRLPVVVILSFIARTTKFSVDQSRMLIEAYEVGTCATTCSTNAPGLDRSKILSELTNFARVTAAASLATYDNVLTRLVIQCASAVWDYWEHQLHVKDISYQVVLAVCNMLFGGSTWPAWFGDAEHFDFVSQKIVHELAEAAPVSTADGILSFVHRKDASPRHGNVLVIPLNSPFAWLLRSEGDDVYSLVSSCNLRQCTAGHYAPLILEDFASSRQLKSFDIV
ncbi:HET-domain-containing protein [Diaporthe eres]|nr:HET-domain-containing protein [Diaporthe eres]